MMDVFTMGDYGVYVWTCFGLTLLVLVVCTVQGWQRHRTIFEDIKTRIRAKEAGQ